MRRNIVFERARFNQRSQGENESVEKYITELYHLAETCEYGDLKEQLLRDRIVVGIRDRAISQRMQMDPDLTLEKAKKMAMQSAAVKEQQSLFKELEGDKGNPRSRRTREVKSGPGLFSDSTTSAHSALARLLQSTQQEKTAIRRHPF